MFFLVLRGKLLQKIDMKFVMDLLRSKFGSLSVKKITYHEGKIQNIESYQLKYFSNFESVY